MSEKASLLAEMKKVAQDKCWAVGGNDLMWFDNADYMSVGVDWVEERFYVADLNGSAPSVGVADYVGLDVLFELEATI
jgi:hypothetical protein